MIRGTTHTIKFDCIDIIEPEDSVEEIEISIDQENNTDASITRYYTSGGCYLDDKTKIISTVLTPQETLNFNTKKKATVQLRIQLRDINQNPYILGNYIQMVTVYPTQRERPNLLGGVSNG